MKDDDRDKFDAQLAKPVAGSASEQVAATGSWSRDAELAQFKRS